MSAPVSPRPLALALHGGSGTILRTHLTAEKEAAYRADLLTARTAGWELLRAGASALEAVEAAACVLEDSPLFNAGRGSVFTADGTHEMDAAVMEGREGRAGAVAGVRSLKNPIRLARKVMEDGQFVLLIGDGAEAFADQQDLERCDNGWFATEERRRQWQAAQAQEGMLLDHDGDMGEGRKFGTIGVVALDAHGDVAAATSTGGLTNKRFGRVGDSPLIGAGTYAANTTCAVSCTGYGEEFIRKVAAHAVAARMQYLGESVEAASHAVIHESLPKINGSGGLIAVDAKGEVSLPYNTEGMYRAWITSAGDAGVAIWDEA